jgi:hypothetical protein
MREAKRTDRTGDTGWRDLAHLAAVVLAVGLLTGLSPACSGDDNGGGGTSTTPCLSYESTAVPGAISITTEDGDPDDDVCDFLAIDLKVHEVDDLFGANFVVTYPTGVVSFNSATGLDSVLASGNTAVDVEARVTNAGEVTIGISRIGSISGVDVDAATYPDGAKLIRLIFIRAGSSGSGDLEFTTGVLLDSGNPPPPKEIPNSEWFGGTIGIIQL